MRVQVSPGLPKNKMKTVTYTNGYIGTYDDTLVKGDLITTYYKGIYEFDYSEDRGSDEVPLYYFRLKYDTNGNPQNSKKLKCCDAAYCRRAKETIDKLIEDYELSIIRLRNIH